MSYIRKSGDVQDLHHLDTGPYQSAHFGGKESFPYVLGLLHDLSG
jgi:hypothetical protein